MRANTRVKLQITKEEHETLRAVGVQRGDNMAPILFLFVMQAFSETLQDKWEKERGLTKLVKHNRACFVTHVFACVIEGEL